MGYEWYKEHVDFASLLKVCDLVCVDLFDVQSVAMYQGCDKDVCKQGHIVVGYWIHHIMRAPEQTCTLHYNPVCHMKGVVP
jgi:hypothetical protein